MIIFQNDGVLDILSLESFGVSVKDNDSAIGFFGTGLKYALAVLMRARCNVTIITGGQTYIVGTTAETIRGEKFNFVTLNDKRLAFTTELGQQWPEWKAYRELYCNAQDEGGSVRREYDDLNKVEVSKDQTAIIVSGHAIEVAHQSRSEFLIKESSRTRLCDTVAAEIYTGGNDAVFYQGVKVYDLQHSSLYTYNLKLKQELTEDRTLAAFYISQTHIRQAIMECENRDVIRDILTIDHVRNDATQYLESNLDFSASWVAPSKEFMEVAREVIESHPGSCNPSIFALLKINRIHALGGAKKDINDERKLAKAQLFLYKAGITDLNDYPILISDKMERYHLGEAALNNGVKEIVLNKRIFSLGVRQVILTLLEEYVHHKYNVSDNSRAMQDVLFEMLVNEMETRLNETI